jgi:hypothetical protein
MSDMKPLCAYVLFATDAEKKYIKINGDGCLSIFDDELSAKAAKKKCHGTDFVKVNYYTEKQVKQLKARVAELEAQETITQLAELMRGLEIPTVAVRMNPQGFYALGRAIADQAKAASEAAILRQKADAVDSFVKWVNPHWPKSLASGISDDAKSYIYELRKSADEADKDQES